MCLRGKVEIDIRVATVGENVCGLPNYCLIYNSERDFYKLKGSRCLKECHGIICYLLNLIIRGGHSLSLKKSEY